MNITKEDVIYTLIGGGIALVIVSLIFGFKPFMIVSALGGAAIGRWIGRTL